MDKGAEHLPARDLPLGRPLRQALADMTMTKEQLVPALQIGSQHFAGTLRFSDTDEAIRLAVTRFPGNADIHHVTIKAVVINYLYSTSIYDVTRLAQHIIARRIDPKLATADPSVVDDIRSGHGIGTNKKGG